MTRSWTATAASYLSRVTKARIGEAVSEAVSEEAALRIGDLKRSDMASEAEALLAGTGWLPSLLRTPRPADAQVLSDTPEPTEQAA
jgi:ParB family chromosome partitioning protein